MSVINSLNWCINMNKRGSNDLNLTNVLLANGRLVENDEFLTQEKSEKNLRSLALNRTLQKLCSFDKPPMSSSRSHMNNNSEIKYKDANNKSLGSRTFNSNKNVSQDRT